MTPSLRLVPVLAALVAPPLAAQTAEEVKSDVLSALATPLPITIVGPLLTRDVVVTEEGDAFRAVLVDTSIMGIFPMGEVSMLLTPLDEDRYRVTEMAFPEVIDIPGMATLGFTGMEFDGTWSAGARSYSDLRWVTEGLTVAPPNGAPGRIGIGRLSFDVVKEPDEQDTESRFAIGLTDLEILDLAPADIRAGIVRVVLAANGERPVDLYSVIRETILRSTMGSGGGDLMALGQSLLGNTYSTVSLDLSAGLLEVRDRTGGAFLTAGAMSAVLDMADVAPRDWGAAEVTVTLNDIEQRDYAAEGSALVLESSTFAVRASELPVADMMTAVMLLGDPPRGRSVQAAQLVDGFLDFGSLEIEQEGTGLTLRAVDRVYKDGLSEMQPLFTGGYDDWSLRLAISGLNRDEGTIALGASASGGRLVPQQAMGPDAAPHVEAWFPVSFALQSEVSGLNEGLLKRLVADLEIADLREPVELVLPMLIYGAATVIDLTSGEDHYETALFRVTQSGTLKFYPTEMLSMSPYTGDAEVTMTGLDALMGYVDAQSADLGRTEASAVKGAFTVLANLAEDRGDGALAWSISRPDVYRREVIVNGITLRYPDVMELLPMLVMGRGF